MCDLRVKEEPMPEVKVEVEPVSVPILWPNFVKVEPGGETELASVVTIGERKPGKHSQDKSSGKRQMQCSDNGTQESHLKQRIKRHIGEKSFRCDVCDYYASKMSILRKHILVKSPFNVMSVIILHH